MDFIFGAVLAGSIVVSGHPSEESCLGRKAMVEKENKIAGTCIRAPSHSSGLTYNGPILNLEPNGIQFNAC